MKAPPIPANESARLRRLEELEILDTPIERSFDNITQIAAAVLGTPIALVSLVDETRQWFKSHHGLRARETSREVSFCGHVVAAGDLMVVCDAHLDARFADNPLVTEDPQVRFYAGAPLRTNDGLVLGTLCAIDHLPRKPTPQQLETLQLLAEQATTMLESRRVFRRVLERDATMLALYEGMQEGVVLQLPTGAIVEANARARELLGVSEDELRGRTLLDPRWMALKEDGSPFPGEEQPATVCLRTGEPQTNVVMGLHKPSGELNWLSVNARPRREEGLEAPTGVVVTFSDITEQRASAQRQKRHERLITVGTLAAGVGHEINNPLSFVMGNLDFALNELRVIGGGSPSARLQDLIDCLSEAKDGTERIRRIVRGLRSLVREEAEPRPNNASEIVAVAVNMSMHEIRSRATVETVIDRDLFVLADEPSLTQVFVNLLTNAAQAFTLPQPERNRIKVTAGVDGDKVRITVVDNGSGIPADVLPRIFDPFFTTKPVGVGTGLGLSISHSVVASLGGELTCETQVGVGTTFSVVLALASMPKDEFTLRAPTTEVPQGKVLIVDDEEGVVRATARLLRGAHEVLGVSDPREAVRRIDAGERFDVIFCDLMMPHLTGADVYARIHAVSPAQAERMVFVSGGVLKAELDRFLEQVPNERLVKPVDATKLKELARSFLSKK
ncbi:MAG: ATP-binding protein [Archangium sp.]|nr:ATP-binding protein [Archangium sp.]MDP3156953.1 ATP-binding protein [Archangium sp.]MDP3575633.1 ATP-binding protein [Archangium sp.]